MGDLKKAFSRASLSDVTMSLPSKTPLTRRKCPWGDSNPRARLRRPLLYPLSYRGTSSLKFYHNRAL